MKELTKYSRVAAALEKLFDKLNDSFFDGELERPVITIQSTPRAYGHITVGKTWSVKGEERRELNIGAGTLFRPIEYTTATMLHEMTHIYCMDIARLNDTSNNGVYHNRHFKEAAEAHGLICTKSERYGYSDTSSVISDELIEWLCDNDIREIELTRHDGFIVTSVGGHSSAPGTGIDTQKPKAKSSTRRLQCPCCGQLIRATKAVNVLCGSCFDESGEIVRMVELN